MQKDPLNYHDDVPRDLNVGISFLLHQHLVYPGAAKAVASLLFEP